MRLKKFLFTSLFIVSAGYFLFDISLKTVDKAVDYIIYLSPETLPDTLYLHTANGRASFHRVSKNKFCQISNCGYVKNLTKDGFDFYWEKYQTLSFEKSKDDENLYILKTNAAKNKAHIIPTISFDLKKEGQTIPIRCSHEKCTIKNEEQPFSFIIGAKKITNQMDFDKSHHPSDSDILILKEKNEFIVLQKKENFFEEIPLNIRQNKFLFIISSFKRPIHLSGLVNQVSAQNYGLNNFDISVSLKGINQDVKKYLLDSDFENLVQKKKLFVRQDENKNQFSNMLDPLRNIDLKQYDYICKIDDDDWYHKDYLKNINLILNASNSPQFLTSGILTTLKKDVDAVYLKTNLVARTGPSICFSQHFAKQLFEIEKMNEAQITPLLLKSAQILPSIKNVYEDLVLNALAQQQNEKYIYFSLTPLFIYNQTNTSIMLPHEQ